MESFSKFSLTFILLFAQTTVCVATHDVALVEFFLMGNESAQNVRNLAAIMDKGAELLRTKYGSIMNVTIVPIYDSHVRTCAMLEQIAVHWIGRYYYREADGNQLMAFFGPDCSTAGTLVAAFAREWNVPMFVSTFDNTESDRMTNKKRYSTLTSVSPHIHHNLLKFVYKVLKGFSYDTVALLCDDANDTTHTYVPLCDELFDRLRLQYNLSASHFYVNASDPANVTHYLDEIKCKARVVFVIGHGSRIRPIMLAAFDKNMTNGDYVYFTFELYRRQSIFGNISWNTNNNDGRDQDAREAYRSLFLVSLKPDDTPEYTNFTKEIKRLSMEKYDYSYPEDEEVDPVAMSHYYALAIYGQVFNETVTMGLDPRDGARMNKLMWNRTYPILGNDVVIDAYGDRDANWLLSQMDPQTGLFQPIQAYGARERIFRTYRDPAVWYKGNQLPPNFQLSCERLLMELFQQSVKSSLYQMCCQQAWK